MTMRATEHPRLNAILEISHGHQSEVKRRKQEGLEVWGLFFELRSDADLGVSFPALSSFENFIPPVGRRTTGEHLSICMRDGKIPVLRPRGDLQAPRKSLTLISLN
jgi:hypothetical protein